MNRTCFTFFLVATRLVIAQEDPSLHPLLQAEENRRINVIEKASASTVCVFSANGQGGGSGVLIDPNGLAVTNFHVVDSCGPHMLCGLNNGQVYDAVIIGTDPVGDLALIRLLNRNDFPVAPIGNSDQIRIGDPCFAAGNPFLLANDFTPSISWGIVSGKNRYQYPSGTLLEYADCLQTDAAINPGNSGGPLFNAQGILIGINGRGSFEKRGRVNVGVGYAISINQVKNYLGSLKSGRILDHSFAGFLVSSDVNQSVRVSRIEETSSAFKQGIRYDCEILALGGREIESVNDFKNVIGTFPPHWSIPIRFRKEGMVKECLIRLQKMHDPNELLKKLTGHPTVKKDPNSSRIPKSLGHLFEARRGYANFRVAKLAAENATREIRKVYNPDRLTEPKILWNGKSRLDNVDFVMNRGKSGLKIGQQTATLAGHLPFENQTSPRGSGGILNAIHIFNELVFGKKDKLAITYHGTARFVSPLTASPCKKWLETKPINVLRIIRDGTESWLYYDTNYRVTGIEYFPFPDSPAAVVEFVGLKKDPMGQAHGPAKIIASFNNRLFVDFTVDTINVVDTTAPRKAPETPRGAN